MKEKPRQVVSGFRLRRMGVRPLGQRPARLTHFKLSDRDEPCPYKNQGAWASAGGVGVLQAALGWVAGDLWSARLPGFLWRTGINPVPTKRLPFQLSAPM